jgi:hypothetical protein
MFIRPLLSLLLILILGGMAQGRPKQLSSIDDYCHRLKAEFIEATPILFSGPDPWG